MAPSTAPPTTNWALRTRFSESTMITIGSVGTSSADPDGVGRLSPRIWRSGVVLSCASIAHLRIHVVNPAMRPDISASLSSADWLTS